MTAAVALVAWVTDGWVGGVIGGLSSSSGDVSLSMITLLPLAAVLRFGRTIGHISGVPGRPPAPSHPPSDTAQTTTVSLPVGRGLGPARRQEADLAGALGQTGFTRTTGEREAVGESRYPRRLHAVGEGRALRVLFVTPHFPEDPSRSISGAYKRMRMWLDAIQSSGATLEMLCFTRSDADASPENAARVSRALADEWGIRGEVVLCRREPIEDIRGVFARYVRPMLTLSNQAAFWVFAGRRQEEALSAALSRSPDVVFFYNLHGATARWTRRGQSKVFLDLPDVEHRRFMREISQPPRSLLKPLRYLWVPSQWWGERAAIIRSDQAFVCSDVDREYLRRTMGVRNVSVIPNAAPRVEDHPPGCEPNVLFVGTYGYSPNFVAAEYLVRKIWPRLSRLCPEAKLLIAGPRSEELPSFRTPDPRVQFLGFVPNLDELYSRTRVFCCPVQSGGGTRLKILEAASYGIPVVSTPIGAEGIEMAPEREIILRQSADELATACAELLADPERAKRVGALGRERVRALYGRDMVVARMRAMLTGEEPAGG